MPGRSNKIVNRARICIITMLFLALPSLAISAESVTFAGWQITAKNIIDYKGFDGFVAVDNVTLVKQGEKPELIATADWLSCDTQQNVLKLRGNIVLHEKPDSVEKKSSQNTVYISPAGSEISRQLVQKSGYQSYQTADNWQVIFPQQIITNPQNKAQLVSQKHYPITQPPLAGAHIFSTEEWDISADQIQHLQTPKTLIASGNVILRKKRSTSNDRAAVLYSDWLSYDVARKSFKLRGNVQVSSETTVNEFTLDKVIVTEQDFAEKNLNSHFAERTAINNWLIAYNQKSSKPLTQPSSSMSTEEWDISAERVIRYENPNSIIGVGNVILTKRERIAEPDTQKDKISRWNNLLPNQAVKQQTIAEIEKQAPVPEFKTTTTIYADWITYDVDLGIIKAKGNVRIDNGQENLYAQKGSVEINSETGVFEDAIITQTNKLHLEGKKIEKTGYDTYRITEGWVVTCKVEEGEKPPWSISSAETNIQQSGFAILKHAKFNVKGIPIFYTPYLVLPVKNTRQTGFLFPEISNSGDNGFGINTPFFWNISESTDLTVYPKYLTKRGLMPGLEFRYVLGAESKGVFNVDYLNDNIDTNSPDYSYNHNNSTRYWLRGKADHTFANGWFARADIDIVSDKDYLNEFDSGVTGSAKTHKRYLETFGRGFSNRDEEQRESTLSLMKNWYSSYLEMSLLAVNDVRIDANGNSIKTDKPFWKLPEVSYSGALPLNILPVTFDWNSSYTHFWRKDGYGGHRIDLHPSIGSNLPIHELLESRMDIGIRDTYYSIENYGSPVAIDQWSGDSSENRLLFDFELEIATTLERNFYSSSSKNKYLEHTIRPFIRYNFLSDENQGNHPFFDRQDRIAEENGITFGLNSYLFSNSPDDTGSSRQRQYAYFEIEQTYYLADITRYNTNGTKYIDDDTFSNLSARLYWYPSERLSLQYETEYNYYGDGFIAHSFTGSYKRDNYAMGLEYSFHKNNNIEELNGFFDFKLNQEWSFDFDFEHSLYDDETEKASLAITYTQPCWAVTFGAEVEPDDTTFSIMFELANIGIPFGGSM